MSRDPKTRSSTEAPQVGLGTLGDLLGGMLHKPPEGQTEPPPAAPPAAPRSKSASKPRTVLARVERKGHGGKTVTTLTGFGPGAPLEELSKKLRKSLGCGSSTEGETILLQGDQKGRVADALAVEGFKVRIG